MPPGGYRPGPTAAKRRLRGRDGCGRLRVSPPSRGGDPWRASGLAGEGHLHLTKLAPGQERYYLDEIETRSAGTWLGAASAELGLTGGVHEAELRAVLRGRDPSTGAHLGRAARRVPGFDLTFLAPKSVSVLHGLGRPEIADDVGDSHASAVAGALRYLERQAAVARRGGEHRQVPGIGLAAAAFVHTTSRAGDPLLHSHVLLANLTLAEGLWSAIDARLLYLHGQTAGWLYHAALRWELGHRLGVEWGPVRYGVAQLDGIDQEVLRSFSQRREAVEARLAEHAAWSPRAAHVAALTTRPAHGQNLTADERIEQWRSRAGTVGFRSAQLDAVVHRAPTPAIRDPAPDSPSPWGEVAGFGRREVVRGWCEILRGGAPVEEVEARADAVLESPEVVPVGMTRTRGIAEARYSTRELVELATEAAANVLRRRHDGIARASSDSRRGAIEVRPELSAAQLHAVGQLLRSGRGVEVIVSGPGPVRAAVLDAARDAWERSGIRVVGVASDARGAAELEAHTGIRSFSQDGLDGPRLPAGPLVVVVESAGKVAPRALGGLLDIAERDAAKVVLVDGPWSRPLGFDERATPPGPFAAVARALGDLDLIDLGHAAAAAMAPAPTGRARPDAATVEHHDGVVRFGATTEATRAALVDDWWEMRTAGRPAVMVASRAADLADLNARARAHLRASGHLGADELTVADGRAFAVGDAVIASRSHRRAGLTSGSGGRVLAVDGRSRNLLVRTDDGRDVEVSAAYLDAGELRHAYAVTPHAATRRRADHALLLGDDAVARSVHYGPAEGARIDRYVVGPSQRRAAEPELDRLAQLAAELGATATGWSDVGELGSTPTSTLAAERAELASRLSADLPPELAPWIRAVGEDRARAERDTREAERQRAAAEGRVAATAGWRARTSPGRRDEARRARAAMVTADERRQAAGAYLRHVRNEQQDLAAQVGGRQRWLQTHGEELRRYAELGRGLRRREALLARAAEAAPPPHVVALLGPRPDGLASREAWAGAAAAIESYRERWDVRDPTPALGQDAGGTLQGIERHHAARKVAEVQRSLGIETGRVAEMDVGADVDLTASVGR